MNQEKSTYRKEWYYKNHEKMKKYHREYMKETRRIKKENELILKRNKDLTYRKWEKIKTINIKMLAYNKRQNEKV